MFRLFRLFIGCNQVGHIYKASWDFEGVLFSKLNRQHLFKLEFMKLLNSFDLLAYCTSYVKSVIKNENIFDLDTFSVDRFIKAWLSLKVFNANNHQELIPFYDGNETGVAAYRNRDDNKLMDELEFSLANSVCGFGVRSGFGSSSYVHTTGAVLWCQSNIIDTPFSDVAFNKEERTVMQIEQNKRTIDSIISSMKL